MTKHPPFFQFDRLYGLLYLIFMVGGGSLFVIFNWLNFYFPKFDEGRVNFAGEGSDALIKFVKEEQLALVNEFSDKTAPKIFGGDLKQHNLLFAAKSAADFDTIMADYTTAAKEFKVSCFSLTI